MKFSRLYRYVFFVFLLLNNAIASPPQRLIIEFNYPLNAAQKQHLTDKIKIILPADFTVLAHSSETRWVIAFNASSTLNVGHAIEEISKLESVKYVEPDNIQNIFH